MSFNHVYTDLYEAQVIPVLPFFPLRESPVGLSTHNTGRQKQQQHIPKRDPFDGKHLQQAAILLATELMSIP